MALYEATREVVIAAPARTAFDVLSDHGRLPACEAVTGRALAELRERAQALQEA